MAAKHSLPVLEFSFENVAIGEGKSASAFESEGAKHTEDFSGNAAATHNFREDSHDTSFQGREVWYGHSNMWRC